MYTYNIIWCECGDVESGPRMKVEDYTLTPAGEIMAALREAGQEYEMVHTLARMSEIDPKALHVLYDWDDHSIQEQVALLEEAQQLRREVLE